MFRFATETDGSTASVCTRDVLQCEASLRLFTNLATPVCVRPSLSLSLSVCLSRLSQCAFLCLERCLHRSQVRTRAVILADDQMFRCILAFTHSVVVCWPNHQDFSEIFSLLFLLQIIFANITTKEPVSLDGVKAPLSVDFTYSVQWIPTG